MPLGAISENVSTAINGLIVNSVFQNSQSQGTPIEQVQPNQIEELRNQSDQVTISSRAKELSSQSGAQKTK